MHPDDDITPETTPDASRDAAVAGDTSGTPTTPPAPEPADVADASDTPAAPGDDPTVTPFAGLPPDAIIPAAGPASPAAPSPEAPKEAPATVDGSGDHPETDGEPEEEPSVDPWTEGKPRVDPDTGMLLPVPPEVPEKSRADRDLEDVREVLREQRFRTDIQGRTDTTAKLTGLGDPASGAPGGEIEIRTVDRRLYISCRGEVVFDREGSIALRRALEAAFVVVS